MQQEIFGILINLMYIQWTLLSTDNEKPNQSHSIYELAARTSPPMVHCDNKSILHSY